MTKAELEKEAEEKAETYSEAFIEKGVAKASYAKGYIKGAEPREKRIEELEAEVKEWKDEWQEQVQKATDEGYARTLQTIQLTKAKDLLLRFIELKNKPCAVGHSINMLLYDNICAEAEQFLNDFKQEE